MGAGDSVLGIASMLLCLKAPLSCCLSINLFGAISTSIIGHSNYIKKKRNIKINRIRFKMNVLITGGAGFIGSHLVDFLIKKKY